VYVSAGGLDVTAAAVTDLAVDHALVTRVSTGDVDLTGAGQTVTVTLALGTTDAQTVIAGMAQNGVWLSLQEAAVPADTSLTSTSTDTGDDQ
jgi:pilus assembly protein CpaB